MRSPDTLAYDLSFLLPRLARPFARAIAVLPAGCALELDGPLVRIRGPSREAVFDGASDVMRSIRAIDPLSISAILHTPHRPSGFDRWTIITGADVAFAPTGLGASFPTRR